MHRTFILHAKDSKLPTDLLGFTCVRYGESVTPSETKAINQKLRKAIESEGCVARIEGLWWQFALTARTHEPSAVSLIRTRVTATARWSCAAAHGKRMAACRRDIGAKR